MTTAHRDAAATGDWTPEPMPMVHRYLGDKRFCYTLPRALSLQILHPGNAASLVQHVHGGLWAHKNRAISEMIYIVYSNRDLRSVMRTAHTHVKGTDSNGKRYHSLNPELFFFQHATYVDTLYTSIETFRRPLDRAEKDELYLECRKWYAKYDISDRAQPATYGEFTEYFEDFCRRELSASADVAALRGETLHPKTWYPRKVPPAAIRALLHPRAAELLEIEVRAGDRAALKAFVAKANLWAGLSSRDHRKIPAARHDPNT